MYAGIIGLGLYFHRTPVKSPFITSTSTALTFSSVLDLGFCGYYVVELAVIIHRFYVHTHIVPRTIPFVRYHIPLTQYAPLLTIYVRPTPHSHCLALHEDTPLL